MPKYTPAQLEQLAFDVLHAAGATHREAQLVGHHLVEANLAGHDSHGMMRVPQYVDAIAQGEIECGREVQVVQETPSLVVLEARRMFGQVACEDATALAMERAQVGGIGAVTIRGANHTGRLGAYVTTCAGQQMIGLVMDSPAGDGQWVAPFGGVARRLGTHPLAIGAPSGQDFPLVVDISTSVVPEGKVRHYLQSGDDVPPGWLIDGEGNPSCDPSILYADVPGAILPLGGLAGHKGFGLSVMIDVLAGALSGAGCTRAGVTSENWTGHGLLIVAIDIRQFISVDRFLEHVAQMVDHIKSSPPAPGFKEILVPGEYEHRHHLTRSRDGIAIPDTTWRAISSSAERLGVNRSMEQLA